MRNARRASSPAASPRARPPTGLPRAAHAVVVLGCTANADGTPGPGLRRRLDQALVELEADPRAVCVVTGGAVWNAAPEALAMQRYLVERGVDPQRVVLEDQARLTIENAELVMPLLQAMGTERITLVTERFHMNRSQRLFHSALKAAGLTAIHMDEAPAPDALDGFERVKTSLTELRSLARDLVNQRQVHLGKPLAIVPAQVTQIDSWEQPPPGYVNWRALFG